MTKEYKLVHETLTSPPSMCVSSEYPSDIVIRNAEYNSNTDQTHAGEKWLGGGGGGVKKDKERERERERERDRL